MKKIYSIIALIVLNTVTIFAQTDCAGCEDHPLIPRMPDFIIQNYNSNEFDKENFIVDGNNIDVEGKKIKIEYKHKNYFDRNIQFPSRLQILRNYSNAFSKAGGTILFERNNAEYGHYTFTSENKKEYWVEIRTNKAGNSYRVTVIERDVMQQEIELTESFIKERITLYGKVTLSGIYFDVANATLRSESDKALQKISAYLKSHPEIKCWVVGHTDTDGSFELNSTLSLNRASAVKNALESDYDIASGRLFAEGVGTLAPIASNDSEKGKQKNRRVELVLK